ncbi:hypothetical protein [Atopomonas sediminilitoris]|uniref:hypothetical protein n=1 Tax=Atopomonas sediminilitoris TaxID=2919919 RepID=UPI001F4DF2C5|nr:hypothetical protein [Atopomonas sediminilitoris]MCJ8170424.1 hypothetical protein [Atopomonas sediminilitoris]
MFRTLLSAALLASLTFTPIAQAETIESAKAELAATLVNVEAGRKQTIDSNLNLGASEAEKFWPLYQDYRGQISELANQGISTLIDYARLHNSQSLTQVDAANILEQVLKRDAQRSVLKEHFINKLSSEISPRVALRFMLIEGQLDSLSRYDALRQIPLD